MTFEQYIETIKDVLRRETYALGPFREAGICRAIAMVREANRDKYESFIGHEKYLRDTITMSLGNAMYLTYRWAYDGVYVRNPNGAKTSQRKRMKIKLAARLQWLDNVKHRREFWGQTRVTLRDFSDLGDDTQTCIAFT